MLLTGYDSVGLSSKLLKKLKLEEGGGVVKALHSLSKFIEMDISRDYFRCTSGKIFLIIRSSPPSRSVCSLFYMQRHHGCEFKKFQFNFVNGMMKE